MKIAAFGEVLWDRVEGQFLIGGAPFNFAAHAVQCGVEASIVSALGEDDLGEKALKEVIRLKVDSRFIQFNKKPTGIVKVLLNNGQPSYEIVKNVAYDFISSQALNIPELNTFEHFYFGTLSQRNSVNRATLKDILSNCQFETTFLDVNLRQNFYSKEILDFSIGSCSILKLNDEEVQTLSKLLFHKILEPKEFCIKLLNNYPNIKTIIITLGGKGCLVNDQGEYIRIHSKPIQVKDTIGAGDSFSAAFLSHYIKNKNVELAAEFANRIGGFVASKKGAIPIYKSAAFL